MEMVTVLKKKKEVKIIKGTTSLIPFFLKDINLFLMSFKIQDVKNKIHVLDNWLISYSSNIIHYL
jgi:cytochrome bd-type quinol oxidase subunit 1